MLRPPGVRVTCRAVACVAQHCLLSSRSARASPALAQTISGRATVISGDTLEISRRAHTAHGRGCAGRRSRVREHRRSSLSLRSARGERARRFSWKRASSPASGASGTVPGSCWRSARRTAPISGSGSCETACARSAGRQQIPAGAGAGESRAKGDLVARGRAERYQPRARLMTASAASGSPATLPRQAT